MHSASLPWLLNPASRKAQYQSGQRIRTAPVSDNYHKVKAPSPCSPLKPGLFHWDILYAVWGPSGGQRRAGRKEAVVKLREIGRCSSASFKMEEGATSQGMWEHLGAGRGKETNLLQSLQKETALLAPWLQPHEPQFGFLTPEL